MSDTADAPEVTRPPRTIVLAFAVTIAQVVLSIANSAMLWGFQDYLRRQLVKSNAKAKKPKDYSSAEHGLHNLNHDLHSGLTAGLIQILVFSLLLMLLAMNFRKGRGWARWAEILVLIIVVQAPFRLLNLGGDAPVLMRVVSALVGLTGLAVIVLLVVPESSRYFAAVRGVSAGDRTSGAASMGFRNLFGPRRPPPDDAVVDVATKSTVTRPARPGGRAPAKPAGSEPSVRAEPKAAPVARSKARAVGDSAPSENHSTPAKPATSVAAKSRGKSRKGT